MGFIHISNRDNTGGFLMPDTPNGGRVADLLLKGNVELQRAEPTHGEGLCIRCRGGIYPCLCEYDD